MGQVSKPNMLVKLPLCYQHKMGAVARSDFESVVMNSLIDVDSDTNVRDADGEAAWKSLYRQYRVLACKIIVTFINLSSGDDFYCWLYPLDVVTSVASTTSTWPEICQIPQIKMKWCSLSVDIHRRVTLSLYRTTKSVLREYKTEGDATSGTTGATPATLGYFHYGITTSDGNDGTVDSVQVQVSVKWYTKFYKRKSLIA